MNMEQMVFQAFDKVLTAGIGYFIFQWLKDYMKTKLDKIDELERKIQKMENFEEFKKLNNGK